MMPVCGMPIDESWPERASVERAIVVGKKNGVNVKQGIFHLFKQCATGMQVVFFEIM